MVARLKAEEHQITAGVPMEFKLNVKGLLDAIDKRVQEAWLVQDGDIEDFWAYAELDINFGDFLEEVK